MVGGLSTSSNGEWVIRDLMVEGLSTSSKGESLSDKKSNGGGLD